MSIHPESCFIFLVDIEVELVTTVFMTYVPVNIRVPSPQEVLQEP